MQIPQHIYVLIEKYLSGNITAEEHLQLDEWYESRPEKEEKDVADRSGQAAMSARLEARILESIKKHKKAAEVKPFFRRHFLYMAAAILLILFSVGSYLYFFSTRQPHASLAKKTVPPANNDIEPGGNKALLTLSDGTAIVLDTAINGTLSQQGNIKVLKLDNGLLRYNQQQSNGGVTAIPVFNTISTPRGGQYQVTLSDGTRVWLNAASSLRFPVAFTGSERKVEITGEAYFEVAHDKQRPFRVESHGSVVEVLGTHFNINAYADETAVKTTLLQGKVKVTSTATAETKTLLPGQQSALDKQGNITMRQHADTEETTAWMHGHFQFKSADLKMVLRQVARWYDVEIVYNGAVDIHFTGQLPRGEKASAIFEKLEMTGAVHFKIENRKIIVSP
ncbi:MAG: FecR family protein [Agriterribacter sp.]